MGQKCLRFVVEKSPKVAVNNPQSFQLITDFYFLFFRINVAVNDDAVSYKRLSTAARECPFLPRQRSLSTCD